MNKNKKKSISHVLNHCGGLLENESLLILCDSTTVDIAEAFEKEARSFTDRVEKLIIPLAKAHGEEPPHWAKEHMLKSDLIMSLCQFSLAHSQARIDASKMGSRFLSLPLYTWDLLNHPAMQVDYRAQSPIVKKVTDLFTNGSLVHVLTEAGTDIKINIEDRIGNYCPGFVENPGDLGSPPDIESNVSPNEDGSNGQVVVDCSITCPELGLLTTPVILQVRDGRIQSFKSACKQYCDILEEMFEGLDSKRRVLAECGVGLNPKATITGTMLTDEGALGCMHFGFGSNHTVGGKNKVGFHLDFVFKQASMRIDGVDVIINGDLVV